MDGNEAINSLGADFLLQQELPEVLRPCREPLRHIRRLAGLPVGLWDKLYLQLFVQFADCLPEFSLLSESDSAVLDVHDPAEMLARTLTEVLAALRRRQHRLLPVGATEGVGLNADRWSYALVSAVLLRALALQSGRRAGVADPASDLQAAGRCAPRGPAYWVQRLLPPSGAAWLAADRAVSTALERVIRGQTEPSGLGALLAECDQRGTVVQPARLVPAAPVAAAFLRWLEDEAGKAAPGRVDSCLYIVREGLLLLSPAAFQRSDAVHWKEVQKRFQGLRLHARTPRGDNIWGYRLRKNERRSSLIKGFLIRRSRFARLGLPGSLAPDPRLTPVEIPPRQEGAAAFSPQATVR